MSENWKDLTQEQIGDKLKAASEHAAPGKHYVRIGERHEIGPCASEYHDTFLFDSPEEFLDYLKNAWLPWATAEKGRLEVEGIVNDLNSYMNDPNIDLDPEIAAKIKSLDADIDIVFSNGQCSKSEMDDIVKKFNEIFESGHPYFWIIVSGDLTGVIKYMSEKDDFGDPLAEDDIPDDEVVRLVMQGKLDENSSEHLDMAKKFFENSASA